MKSLYVLVPAVACLLFAVQVSAQGVPPFSRTGNVSSFDGDVPVARATPVDPAAADSGVYSRVRIDENYVLRPGDRVSFAVAEDRKPSTELTVMASGELEIPNVGRFPAAGMTCRAVAARLKAELERTHYKKATVTLALNQAGSMPLQGTSNIRVYFMGAVRAQGAREFPPDGSITVSKAILIAGGFADFANQGKVQLIRRAPNGESKIIVVNVANLLRGKSGPDPVLQAEDMIRVPEKWINF